MPATNTYHVPVTRRILDVYTVEAKSKTDAGVQAGMLIAEGKPPTSTTELSRNVGAATLAGAGDTAPGAE